MNLLKLLPLLFVSGMVCVPAASLASKVLRCNEATNKCAVKTQEGLVNDHVKIVDLKGREVATGKITKKEGSFVVVDLISHSKLPEKDYAVIVQIENEDLSARWAAGFSNN